MIQTASERDSGASPGIPDRAAEPQCPRPLTWPPPSGLGSALANCENGSVAVEFALASVPLMLMVFGFIATAAVFNTWSTMQSNTQYAARLMSTGQITSNNSGTISTTNTSVTTACSSSMRSTQVEYYACTGLPTWTSFNVTTTENCATPSVTVTLTTSATTAAIADIEKIFSGNTIVATTIMMKEGTCP
jgi:Flp pilus assembly protein TadG